MEFRKMVTITLCTRQQKRHWCIEQSYGLCGRNLSILFPLHDPFLNALLTKWQHTSEAATAIVTYTDLGKWNGFSIQPCLGQLKPYWYHYSIAVWYEHDGSQFSNLLSAIKIHLKRFFNDTIFNSSINVKYFKTKIEKKNWTRIFLLHSRC